MEEVLKIEIPDEALPVGFRIFAYNLCRSAAQTPEEVEKYTKLLNELPDLPRNFETKHPQV